MTWVGRLRARVPNMEAARPLPMNRRDWGPHKVGPLENLIHEEFSPHIRDAMLFRASPGVD